MKIKLKLFFIFSAFIFTFFSLSLPSFAYGEEETQKRTKRNKERRDQESVGPNLSCADKCEIEFNAIGRRDDCVRGPDLVGPEHRPEPVCVNLFKCFKEKCQLDF